MTVVLTFPPFVSDQTGPPAGLSALAPYLGQHGVKCRVIDLNVEFFWYFWNNWDNIAEILRESLEARLVAPDISSSLHQKILHNLRLTLPLLNRCRDRSRGAADACRSAAAEIPQDASIVREGLANALGVYYFGDSFGGGCLQVSLDELAHHVRISAQDAFLNDFLGRYDFDDIDLAGFSLLSQSQLPYAMLFAEAVRARTPGIRTVAGGPYITEMIADLTREVRIFDYFDSLVVHEGESALLQIATRDEKRFRHPNIFEQGQHPSGRSFVMEDIDSLPDQDFSQFRLNLYRSDGISLPLYSSKGCSWGRCAFCSVNFLRYRERNVERFFDAALRAARSTGIRSIQLVDEDVPPERLHRLAELALATAPDQRLRWFLQTRFYPKLDRELLERLAEADFATIEFGLESVEKRTLKIVKKGISLPIVHRILSDCDEVGIKVILNFMIGFPWETEAAGQRALDFVDDIVRRHPGLDLSCNTQEVKIYLHSDLHRSPNSYGIESSEPLPLSPITRWQSPNWVQDFVRRNRRHLLFSRRSSIEATSIVDDAIGVEASPLARRDPRIVLAPEWYHLPMKSRAIAVDDWSSGSLLVNAASGLVDAFRLNPTLESVLVELGEGRQVSSLKERFLDRYPDVDRDETLGVLGKALIILNQMGALSFCGGNGAPQAASPSD